MASEPLCRIELIGGLRVEVRDRIITRFTTQKTASLLAFLAYFSLREHPREILIELLWPGGSPRAGRTSLSQSLSALRRQLEPPGVVSGSVLLTTNASVRLNSAAISTDVADFEQALQTAAKSSSTTERTHAWQHAIALYRGELLPGFYEDWVLTEQRRLAALYFQAVHALIAHLEKAGELPQALHVARQAVSVDPLQEETHAELMRLYAALGQPTTALEQYRELQRLLEEQLGTQPSPALQKLARRIELQEATASPVVVPAHSAALPSVAASLSSPHPLPFGTVTFLLTDIEGSTRLRERAGQPFQAALNLHHTLLRQTVALQGGHEVKEAGDSFVVAFDRASDALSCAIVAQTALASAAWPEEVGPLPVRMALHTGEVRLENGEYQGLVLYYASRMLTAAHGGQVLCSDATASLVRRDLEPGVRLLDLGIYRLRDLPSPERLFQLSYPTMSPPDFPALKAEAGYQSNLPLQLTRFFGRETAIAQLSEMLVSDHIRLLTITGPGGTGKTRLSLEVAGLLLEAFAGAVWFVPLVDLTDGRLIAGAIVDALRLPRSPTVEPLEQAVEALARQRCLLVLDNFEQVVEQGSEIVRTLLERVPGLTVLVTSRHTLGLSGEREFALQPLSVPNGAHKPDRLSMFESVRLFVDRAQAVRPAFQVTNSNAPAVAELCDRLEGIPLAIELAAARAQVMTPAQMLAQLERRFDFLVSRKRDATDRHRTLRAAIDWSYHLLPEQTRRFFARLSVFRGGWTVEAAVEVCLVGSTEGGEANVGQALAYLTYLQECSMALTEESETGMRFRMLETLREYASDRLEEGREGQSVRERHQGYFVGLAEEAEPQLVGSEQAAWLDRLEREHDNLRAALEWGNKEAALRLAGALWRFWSVRGYLSEGRERLTDVLAAADARAHSPARAKVLNGAGTLAYSQGDYAVAQTLYTDGMALYQELGDKQGIAWSLSGLGHVAREQSDFSAAYTLFEESLTISRELGDKSGIASSLNGLGLVSRLGPTAKRTLHEESLAIRRELGDKQGIAWALLSLGDVVQNQGDYAGARRMFEESLTIMRELGDKWGIAQSLHNLGMLAFCQGDYAAAHTFYEESMAIVKELGNKQGVANSLRDLADVARVQGDYAAARMMYEEGLAMARELGNEQAIAWSFWGLGLVAQNQGDYAAARTLHEKSLTIERALGNRRGIASQLINLGDIARVQGDYAAARTLYEESLTIMRALGDKWGITWSLGGLGGVASHQGDYAAARTLYEERLAILRALGNKSNIAWSLHGLGNVAREQGDYAAAHTFYEESMAIRRELGEKRGTVWSFEAFAALAAAQDQARRAAILWGAAEALREKFGAPLPPPDRSRYDRQLAQARAAVSEDAFAAAWAEGRAMTLEQAMQYALENVPPA